MIKKFDQFINENDSTEINWEEIEELCMNTPDLPDCIPTNIRQWDVFIRQYERIVDLVNRKWEPHYDWETEEEFEQAVNEQFYLGKGYKHSIYECFEDLSIKFGHFANFKNKNKNLFKNVDWRILKNALVFTEWNVFFNSKSITRLPTLLPKKVGGSFYCHNNKLTSLKGCPEYVGGYFNCCQNNLTSLEGAPKYVGGNFYCNYNELPDSIPIEFPGKDLHKYINL